MATDNQPPVEDSPTEYNSYLFTVRVWQEAVNHQEAEWRGRLQHVPSGQVYYFRTWNMLIRNLLSMLPGGGYVALQASQLPFFGLPWDGRDADTEPDIEDERAPGT